MPLVLGVFQDLGFALVNAATASMVVSALLAIGLIWLGPETRGRVFTADEFTLVIDSKILAEQTP